jgi:hypothetical protein
MEEPMSASRSAPSVRPRPPIFRALGADEPPAEVIIDGRTFARIEIFKHDSWAATALYSDDRGKRVVCKFNRSQPAIGIGLIWLGRRLAHRENRALERLRDLPNVPLPCGRVRVNGRDVPTAAARVFVPGHPLAAGEHVCDDFFPELLDLLAVMHRRGIAYVDLHKRENILVGDDGRPYLIDFQISFDATHPRVRWLPGIRGVFEMLCRSDLYHLAKHVKRHRPDQSLPGLTDLRPWWIDAHRAAAAPFRELRRRLLVAVKVRSGKGRAVTEHAPEDAVRRERDGRRHAA